MISFSLDNTYKKMHGIVKDAKNIGASNVAVVFPTNDVSLQGAIESYRLKIITPILIGSQKIIQAIAKQNKINIEGVEIIDIDDPEKASVAATKLVHEGKVKAIMKGNLHTDELMRALTNKETGLRTSRRFSHCFVLELPEYHKLLIISDAAINIYPNMQSRVDIVKNAKDLANALGISIPKVALLSAVEHIYPKIETTLELPVICKMADRGQLGNVIVDGPLAFDNAISKEAADIKGIKSEVSGDVDILVGPNIEACNIMAKSLIMLGRAESAGIVLGAKVPVILTSRSDSINARVLSAALVSIYSNKCNS